MVVTSLDLKRVLLADKSLKNLSEHWAVDLWDADGNVLVTFPVSGSFCFQLYGDDKKLSMFDVQEAVCLRTGTIRKFKLYNVELPGLWLTGDCGGLLDGREMTFDVLAIQTGSKIWLDTFRIWL